MIVTTNFKYLNQEYQSHKYTIKMVWWLQRKTNCRSIYGKIIVTTNVKYLNQEYQSHKYIQLKWFDGYKGRQIVGRSTTKLWL